MTEATRGERRAGASALLVGRGPLALEAALLERIEALASEARQDPRLLATPVRVVVPSRSLRAHLAARIARALGPSAGLVVQTLHGTAAEIVERHHEHGTRSGTVSEEWVEILVRRFARADDVLAEPLQGFDDGFRAVVSTVRDLLDSGLEAGTLEALQECLAGLRMPVPERRRVGAVLNVACRVADGIERDGIGGRGQLLRAARELLDGDAQRALPTRALFVHGFVDATGRAAELIETLVRRLDGSFLLDLPDDPVAAGQPDLGARFADRLRERMQGVLGPPLTCAMPEREAPTLLRAPDPESEVRAMAERIRQALAAGAAPETIAVVARDLGPYRVPLRRHLGRLGIPFSALRTRAPLDGAGRRLMALGEILTTGRELTSERWLDCVGALRHERNPSDEASRPKWRPPSSELRLGLRLLGAVRLEEIGELAETWKEKEDAFRLPTRRGVRRAREGEQSPESFTLARVRLYGGELRAARRAARRLLSRLEGWPEHAPIGEHLRLYERLRRYDLGWLARSAEEQRARAALEALGGQPLTAQVIAREEFALLVRRALRGAAAPLLGGAGGGVQVLDAMEARARTFEHLFLIGLERDSFPRVVRQDPLLADSRRRAFEALLPDIPIKARGRAEDRHLFAQLLSAARHTTLSWPACDEDGKRKVVSPLVERLLEGTPESEVEGVPALHAAADDAPAPRTAAEHAILAGLAGTSSTRVDLFRLCHEEVGARGEPLPVARARAAVLTAFERGPHEPRRLAPWLGFLGGQEAVGVRPDPRDEPPFVTLIEALSRCPWQALLSRVLKLEAGFEALDGPTRIDPRTVGNVVHKFMEVLAKEVVGPEKRTLEEVLARKPVPVPWPAPERHEALLLEVARKAFEPARAPESHVRWLAERARPHLELARELMAEEASHGGGTLGVELEGRARVGVEPDAFEVRFRADHAGRVGEQLVLTDYKTGQAIDAAKLRKEGLPRGLNLQPAVYALSARGVDPDVRGRYLFLSQQRAKNGQDVSIGQPYAATAESDLLHVLEVVFGAWRAGVFFPRLYDEKSDREPDACRTCKVAQACLRGDSGARMALTSWVDEPLGASPTEEALRELWQLAQTTRVAKKR